MLLPALYHWSPTERRMSIMLHGLQPFSRPVVSSVTDDDGNELTWAYVCLSPTPSGAWSISGDMEWASEVDEWDLWQVRLAEGDEVRMQPFFGNVLREVRVFSAIPPDRAWLVGSRKPHVAKVKPSPIATASDEVDPRFGVCGCGAPMDQHGCPQGH